MKKYFSQKKFLSILCVIFLIDSTYALSRTNQQDVNKNVQYPKAITLQNGNILVLTSEEGSPQVTHIAELDKDGNVLYNTSTIPRGFTADAQLVRQGDTYILSHHNKQNLPTSESKEYMATFKEKGTNLNAVLRSSKFYQKSSLVALKKPSTSGALTTAEVALFNPTTRTFSSGQSINSPYSSYIHCYEQRENEVYCLYVAYEDKFISKLKMKHYTVNGDRILY